MCTGMPKPRRSKNEKAKHTGVGPYAKLFHQSDQFWFRQISGRACGLLDEFSSFLERILNAATFKLTIVNFEPFANLSKEASFSVIACHVKTSVKPGSTTRFEEIENSSPPPLNLKNSENPRGICHRYLPECLCCILARVHLNRVSRQYPANIRSKPGNSEERIRRFSGCLRSNDCRPIFEGWLGDDRQRLCLSAD